MTEKKQDTTSIAYCGLNCGDCHGFTGEISDLARDLRKALRDKSTIYLQILYLHILLEKISKIMENVIRYSVQWLNSVVKRDVELVVDHLFVKSGNVH